MICRLNVNSTVLTTTAELDRKPIYHWNKQIPCRPAWWNFITCALIDGLDNLEHMKIPKCQPLIPESGMNWGCLTSLALHPGPSRLLPSSVLHSVRAHHFSDSSAPPLPGAQYVVCQARGVGTHQSISLISIKYNLASQLFQTLPLQDPLWGSHPEPDLEETHGIDPRSPWSSTHFFLGRFSFLCQGLFHSGY